MCQAVAERRLCYHDQFINDGLIRNVHRRREQHWLATRCLYVAAVDGFTESLPQNGVGEIDVHMGFLNVLIIDAVVNHFYSVHQPLMFLVCCLHGREEREEFGNTPVTSEELAGCICEQPTAKRRY